MDHIYPLLLTGGTVPTVSAVGAQGGVSLFLLEMDTLGYIPEVCSRCCGRAPRFPSLHNQRWSVHLPGSSQPGFSLGGSAASWFPLGSSWQLQPPSPSGQFWGRSMVQGPVYPPQGFPSLGFSVVLVTPGARLVCLAGRPMLLPPWQAWSVRLPGTPALLVFSLRHSPLVLSAVPVFVPSPVIPSPPLEWTGLLVGVAPLVRGTTSCLLPLGVPGWFPR